MGKISKSDIKVVVDFIRALQSDENSRIELTCFALIVAMAEAGARNLQMTACGCKITVYCDPADDDNGAENV
jgi:hypothetical protein